VGGRDYETMYSWHRNSFLRLGTNIIYAICAISWLTSTDIDTIIRARSFFPLVVLSILVLFMVSFKIDITMYIGDYDKAQKFILLVCNWNIHHCTICFSLNRQ